MIFIHTVSIVMALAVPLMYCVNMHMLHQLEQNLMRVVAIAIN